MDGRRGVQPEVSKPTPPSCDTIVGSAPRPQAPSFVAAAGVLFPALSVYVSRDPVVVVVVAAAAAVEEEEEEGETGAGQVVEAQQHGCLSSPSPPPLRQTITSQCVVHRRRGALRG